MFADLHLLMKEGEPISDRAILAQTRSASAAVGQRIDWIDYAKGVSIILVVMMHSVLGVEIAMGARGALHVVVDFAAPFRVPAFFLLSGLLLSRTIDQSWPVYLDRKVLHFVYFYLLWLVINCIIKFGLKGVDATLGEILFGLVEPFGTLWFIYVLPLFFVASKLARRWPALLFASALALNLLAPHTGWTAIDEFNLRLVFFVSGYLGVRYAMALADWASANILAAGAALLVAAALAGAVFYSGWAVWKSSPGLLVLAYAGSAAVIIASSLLAHGRLLEAIRLCGQNSLAIYLAFFLPMAAAREAIVRFAPAIGPTVTSVIVTLAAVVVPLVMERAVRGSWLGFVFQRPQKLQAGSRISAINEKSPG